MISGALKWGSFYNSEALIVPTHQENFGLVFAEAMSCNLPVLTTTGVNISETIESSGAGFIAPDTVEGIPLLLNQWLDLSPEEKPLCAFIHMTASKSTLKSASAPNASLKQSKTHYEHFHQPKHPHGALLFSQKQSAEISLEYCIFILLQI